MFSGLESPMHLLVVLIVAVLVFGPKRLPEVGRSLGSGLRQFKQSVEGNEPEPTPAADPKPAVAPAPAPTEAGERE